MPKPSQGLYAPLIMCLEDDVAYSAVLIVTVAELRGIWHGVAAGEVARSQVKASRTMVHYPRTYGFGEPDGKVTIDGRKHRAWFGWKWKQYALDDDSRHYGEAFLATLDAEDVPNRAPDLLARMVPSPDRAVLVPEVQEVRPEYLDELAAAKLRIKNLERMVSRHERMAKLGEVVKRYM